MTRPGKNVDRQCAKCGACVPVCPVYQVTGREAHAARGKIHLLEHLDPAGASRHLAEILSQCLLCGACADACPRGIDTPVLVRAARQALPHLSGRSFLSHLAQRAITHPGLLPLGASTARAITLLPPESGLRLRLRFLETALPAALPPKSYLASKRHQDPVPGGGIAYFTGCLANHLAPEIGEAVDLLLEKTTDSPALAPADQTCCGLAAASSGNLRQARRLARKNISAFETGNEPIITSCASCYRHLATYPELLADDDAWRGRATAFAGRLVEFSTFFSRSSRLADLLAASPHGSRGRIVYHDPCHLRFGEAITAPPRRLLSHLAEVEILELPRGPRCCGHGGLFQLAHPDLAQAIRAELLVDLGSLDPDAVLSTCTGCLLHLHHGLAGANHKTAVLHLGVLLADSLR